MIKTIALALLLATLAVGGPAEAGKYNGAGLNHNQPSNFAQTPRDCSGPQYHYRNNPCAPWGSTSTPTQPHGGCGYKGPNGVFIECK